MKNLAKCVLAWLLCVAVCVSCMPIQTAYAGVSISAWMDSYTPGNTITIMWMNNVEGAHHYDCTVLNETTGSYARSRSTSSSGYDAYVTAKTAGVYKIWVGAVDANGNDITSSIIRVTVMEATCDHDWNDDTGTCIDCGEACSHGNGVYEIETGSYSESISDTHHEIIWTYNEECKICRYVLRSGASKTETGKHKLDSNGDCTLCDYRAACKHTETTTEHLSTTYEQNTKGYHRVRVVRNIICANANCGKMIEYGGEIESWTEEHEMSGDRCTKCGYTVEYDPLQVSISRGQSSAYTGATISASCSASGGSGSYAYYWSVKLNGSEVYSTGSWDKSGSYTANAEGTYSFSVRVEDKNTGKSASASTSGITVTNKPCEHPNKTTVQDGATQYIKASDSKHTVRKVMVEVCGDCGERLNSWNDEKTENHNYSGENCVNCGAAAPAPEATACVHPSKVSKEINRSWRATTSADQHLVDITWEDRCASCNTLLNKTRVSTEYENHKFDGLVCTKCGYAKQDPNAEKPCDHAEHREEITSRNVQQHDGKFHIVYTNMKVYCANPDCGILLNADYEKKDYYYHKMEGNTCKDCGYTADSAPVVPNPGNDEVQLPSDIITSTPETDKPAEEQVQVCSVYGAAHNYNYVGYEAAHETELDYPGSHNIFKRCKCGHVIYTGETKTMLDKSVCCYCGNHQYGNEYQEGDEVKQKCKNCSKTKVVRKIDNPTNISAPETTQITILYASPEEANQSFANIMVDPNSKIHQEMKKYIDMYSYVDAGTESATSQPWWYNAAKAIYTGLTDSKGTVQKAIEKGAGYNETVEMMKKLIVCTMLYENPTDPLAETNAWSDGGEFVGKVGDFAGYIEKYSDYVAGELGLSVPMKTIDTLLDARDAAEETGKMLTGVSMVVDGVEFVCDTQEELEKLARLIQNEAATLAFLEKLESAAGADSIMALACSDLKKEMKDAYKSNEIWKSFFEHSTNIAYAATTSIEVVAESTMGEVLTIISIGGSMGDLITEATLGTGTMVEAENQLINLKYINDEVERHLEYSMGSAGGLGYSGAYQLARLYLTIQEAGLCATEKYMINKGWDKSVWDSLHTNIDAQRKKTAALNREIIEKYKEGLVIEIEETINVDPQTTIDASPVSPVVTPTESPTGAYCTVRSPQCTVRDDAGSENGYVARVENGVRFKIHDSKQAENGTVWYKVFTGAEYGWISSNTVTLDGTSGVSMQSSTASMTSTPDTSSGTYCIVRNSNGANARKEPNPDSDYILHFAPGTRFKILEEKVGTNGSIWYKVNVDGSRYGWVSSVAAPKE